MKYFSYLLAGTMTPSDDMRLMSVLLMFWLTMEEIRAMALPSWNSPLHSILKIWSIYLKLHNELNNWRKALGSLTAAFCSINKHFLTEESGGRSGTGLQVVLTSPPPHLPRNSSWHHFLIISDCYQWTQHSTKGFSWSALKVWQR